MRPILCWLVIAAALLAGGCTTAAPPAADSTDTVAAAPAPVASLPAPYPAPEPRKDASSPVDDSDSKADSAIGEVDFSCSSNAECTVKNVGNCCGYYPACVNVYSETFPEQVKAQCERSGMMSVCGFPAIEACQCVQGRCEPAGSGGAGQQER